MKPKKTTIEFIEREKHGQVAEPYEIMERLIRTERHDLAEAKIGIAWRIGWKRDKDGLLKVGQCKKRNELDRTLDDYDFVILINAEAWPTFNGHQRERLIFHELEHAQIECDANDDQKRDTKGRLITRGKKHDIQEFRSVVEKYGWDEDLSDLAVAGIEDAKRPLLNMPEAAADDASTPEEGITAEDDEVAEKCEGCRKPATRHDNDGVPLCDQCAAQLKAEDAEPINEPIVIKCKGMKQASVTGTIRRDADGWRCDYEARLGNYTGIAGTKQQTPSCTRQVCVLTLRDRLNAWLDGIEITGTADQKRAMTRRRDMMREQVNAAMEELLDADTSDEDPPRTSDERRETSDESDADENEEI